MRIVEPLLKAHLALWLVKQGARRVDVSIDGAEPDPASFGEVMVQAGYTWSPLPDSRATFTGSFVSGPVEVVAISKPGPDMLAELPGRGLILVECKGEPTPKGVSAGGDITAFHTGLGQLIVAAGRSSQPTAVNLLGVPDTVRLRGLATEVAGNPLLAPLGVKIVLVTYSGDVTILPDW